MMPDCPFKSARSHPSAMKLLMQLGNHLEELILCPLQVSQQSMTPFGVVRLPAFHIGKQGVVSLIHSVFGFLYFSCPRHDLDSTTPPEKQKGRKRYGPGQKLRSIPPLK